MDSRLMLGYYIANISRSLGRVIFVKGSANVILVFSTSNVFWTSEIDWVQNTAIHWVCFVCVHFPLLFWLKQLQVTLASSSLQVSGHRLVVWHLKAKNTFHHTYCHILNIFLLTVIWHIFLTAMYFRRVTSSRLSYLLHAGFRQRPLTQIQQNFQQNIFLTKNT